MRKLLNTLYVTSEGSYLALENNNVVVLQGDERKGQFPLSILEGIVCFSYKGASPALMGACGERGIQLCFHTPRGRFLARVCGEDRGNVLLRKQQYRVSDDPARSCLVARNMILGKVFNARWILERALRDHALRLDVDAMKQVSRQLADLLPAIETATDLDSLRGLEGEASARYFSVFDQLILNQKEAFTFSERNRRPPRDNVNALLSFSYILLANDCSSALESVGLDAYVGFMHRDKPGRASLALDLMEELRGPLADRLVLTLINTHKLQPKHFSRHADGSVLLSDEGRRIFLNTWQERKQDTLTHPYLQEKLCWGLVPYVQALLLARHLRGDLSGYPTFFWK